MRGLLILAMILPVSAGCQTGKSVGKRVLGASLSLLLENEDDRARERERQNAWRTATGGAWNGVEYDAR